MFGALLRDIADRHSAKQRLEHLAHCDTLTALPNRNALHDRLAADIADVPCALLLLDLDGFKHVNDTLGHSAGDKLLTAVASRLRSAAEADGFVCRLGGDEFAILLSDCADPHRIDEITTRIFKVLRSPFELVGQSVYVGTSIGVAMSPKDASMIEPLLSSADLALYSAKSEGGGLCKFFTRAMLSRSEQRVRLGADLRRALINNEFELWFQPQVLLSSTGLAGVEALLRWRHPDDGLLSPQSFMDVLEGSAIAEEVGDWVVEQACKTANDWNRMGIGPIRMGINLFAAQLRSGRLVHVIESAIAKYDLSMEQLELEVTENTVLINNVEGMKVLRELRSLGAGIAFDDFGTGFASLSLLQEYPLTRLKIDRSFGDYALCDTIGARDIDRCLAALRPRASGVSPGTRLAA